MAEDLEVELNNKEYNLLICFVENSNRVLTREQILDKVWGYDFDGDIRNHRYTYKNIKSKAFKLW